ncbi:pentatricopeptide repeat-containing protein At5g66520-like [Nymphaea colorata]|uniref:DYW domain-containing protein n=1 Tax=Nymphaea colorata TaxID=210225 RepID=A0A5K1BHW5_9MAGN|nr:pentatricopeptide repeat-containing protein At5g66520-like [Nymphaea colorata]XP_031481587.1 pentatricopeptide repeat-containing protein At5g66520-like [Nymphaea colorata]
MALPLATLQLPPPAKLHENHPSHQLPPSLVSVTGSLPLQNFTTPFQLKQLHAQIVKQNVDPSILSFSKVAQVCGLSPDFGYGRQLLQFSDRLEIVIWNSWIRKLAESDSPADAIILFRKLRYADVPPDTLTCSFVLKACSRVPSLEDGMMVHSLAAKQGWVADVFLQNTIIHMYASCGSLSSAYQLFAKTSKRDVVTWNIMITQFAKQGQVDIARKLFDEMPERSTRSWTSMITGYVQCGRPNEAISVFRSMEEANVKPNEVTVVSVLAACADVGALDLGQRIHAYAKENHFRHNVRVCNTLIDMYTKCGCIEEARMVFDEIPERTVVSWSAMIMGHAIHGQSEEALSLFSKMQKRGIDPNAVTFIGLLHACSHMGMVAEGCRFFNSMVNDYRIVPQIEHYGCMVDLLSRAGLLKEAYEFIKNMPIEPSGAVWGALLGGCRVHKSVELGEEVIKHLLEIEPHNDGYYVVLSNIYAEAGRWGDVAKVRRLMKDRGIKKTPGCSFITIDGVTHEFVAGDGSHPHAKEVQEKWHELAEQLKLMGYVPETSAVLLDIAEEEKEHALYRHSEKLAVVFGLMKTSPGTPIRIMKNLRVCADCHLALKLISKFSNREIIVRDRSRFHRFVDGSCSCKDYW